MVSGTHTIIPISLGIRKWEWYGKLTIRGPMSLGVPENPIDGRGNSKLKVYLYLSLGVDHHILK